jgi:glycosyltransferase involved in cell wall biosynthesis
VYLFFNARRADRLSNQTEPNRFSDCLDSRRILLVIHALEGGGSERQIACLANYLARNSTISGLALVTISSKKRDVYPLEVRVERFSLFDNEHPLLESANILTKLIFHVQCVRRLKAIAAQFQPDVVVSFCDRTNALVLLSLGKQYPVLISERSDPRFQLLPKFWERIRRKVYRRAKVVVSQSADVSDYLRGKYFPKSTPATFLTIPSAIESPGLVASDQGTTHQSAAATTTPNRLLFVGRLAPEKQIDRILHAWKAAQAQLPHWVLRIVGKGPLEAELKRLAEELEIGDRVQWCGWTSDVWSEYRQARAFVMASRYEGFPQALVEAMTAGLPCFVTNFSPAVGECIEHLESGIILRDISELSLFLKQLDGDSQLEQRIAIGARRVANRYQWSTVAPEWEGAIFTAVANRKGAKSTK